MELTTESLITFFKRKLSEVDQLDIENDEKGVERWWSNVVRCGGRMGKEYLELLGDVRFHAGAYLMGEPEYNKRLDIDARINGVEEAKNNIGKVLDDLSEFGYSPENDESDVKVGQGAAEKYINNVMVSTHQSANVVINLSEFDKNTQNIITELQNELKKKQKNKEMIKKLLGKLAETSLDALERIFLHSVGIG
ncbi:hypothetical protein IKF32_00675 [Candidatus Saccharibacteria bacterium]|nr:hypothetical protein [Candidatus Saccharibacteria bacterium]